MDKTYKIKFSGGSIMSDLGMHFMSKRVGFIWESRRENYCSLLRRDFIA